MTSLLLCVYAFGGREVHVGPSGGKPVSAFLISVFAVGGSAFWAQIVGALSSVKDIMQQTPSPSNTGDGGPGVSVPREPASQVSVA